MAAHPKLAAGSWTVWYGTKCPGPQGLRDCGHKPAVVRVTHRCRRVSAEDESGAEFIGGVDFEVVFAG
jgi:hypothetical protein